jgi:PDZ domain-containing protein
MALAVLRRPAKIAATMANPAIQAARVENSVTDTAQPSVANPAAPLPARPPSLRQQVWAIPLVTIAVLIIAAVLVASVWPATWYETAPGSASEVARRLAIRDTETFEAGNILFVTAGGSELTPLMAFAGWIDPVVDVANCHQAGRCGVPRSVTRVVNLGAMATAKQIAEYVALSRLGFDATLDVGVAQVQGFSPDLCPPDAPATRACNALDIGDTIVALDGVPTPTLEELSAITATHRPGDRVTIRVTPFGSSDESERTVELIASPDDADRAIIGFSPRDTRTVSVPVTIDIDTDQIGGPSAGLAFTLALIDALTPGALTGTTTVAVTGTIDANGNVGPIGALPQKADAVRRAGASVFIVPKGQSDADLARAAEIAGDGVEIVTVATLDEALDVITAHGGQPSPLEPLPTN